MSKHFKVEKKKKPKNKEQVFKQGLVGKAEKAIRKRKEMLKNI